MNSFQFQDGETTLEIEPEGESHTTVDSGVLQEIDRDALMGNNSEEIANVEALLSDPSTELTPKIEAAIKAKWQKIVGPEIEIVVSYWNFLNRPPCTLEYWINVSPFVCSGGAIEEIQGRKWFGYQPGGYCRR